MDMQVIEEDNCHTEYLFEVRYQGKKLITTQEVNEFLLFDSQIKEIQVVASL